MKPLVSLLALFLTGCTTALPPLKTVENVDLPRFMGPWYVIACIPTFIETEAYNAIEEYRLQPDGTIQTIFTFNKGVSMVRGRSTARVALSSTQSTSPNGGCSSSGR